MARPSARSLHRWLVYAAYGWLVFTGAAHFFVDVVSQHLRGVRVAGVEAELYYGLNTAFALGQLVFGLMGVWLASRAPHLLKEAPALVLSAAAGLGWLVVTLLFMNYWEPKLNAAVFCLLVLAVAASARAERWRSL